MEQWYLSREGSQEGPYPEAQLRELLQAPGMDPSKVFVWKTGMGEWQTALSMGMAGAAPIPPAPGMTSGSPAPGLRAGANPVAGAPLVSAQQPAPASADYTNPYQAPMAQQPSHSEFQASRSYGGMGRLAYFLSCFGLLIGFSVVIGLSYAASVGEIGMLVGVVLMAVGLIITAVKRLQNLGMSGWFVLATLVPIVSIWISFRLIACPEGYEDHRELDTAGKILGVLVIVFFGLSIVGNAFL